METGCSFILKHDLCKERQQNWRQKTQEYRRDAETPREGRMPALVTLETKDSQQALIVFDDVFIKSVLI